MGIKVNAFSIETLMFAVHDLVSRKKKTIIANHNLNSLSLVRKDAEMNRFYSLADAVHIDGMPIVFIGRLLGFPLSRVNRITYVDWTPHIMRAAAKKHWQICYVGSKPGVGEQAVQVLCKSYQNLKIKTHHGYFDVNSLKENRNVQNFVNDCNPDILLIGMGMPRQEKWILKNLEKLPDCLILPCGAALDYEAGITPTPPRWAGCLGFEWLCRLVAEPKRLWRRYLKEPWSLVMPFAKELWSMRIKGQ